MSSGYSDGEGAGWQVVGGRTDRLARGWGSRALGEAFACAVCPLTRGHLSGGHIHFKRHLFKKAFPAPLLLLTRFIL